MKIVLIFIFAVQLSAMGTRSQEEYVIEEKEDTPKAFPVLAPTRTAPNRGSSQLEVLDVKTTRKPAQNLSRLEPLDNAGLEQLEVAVPSQVQQRGNPRNNNNGRRQNDNLARIGGSGSRRDRNVRNGQRGQDGQDAMSSKITDSKLEVMLPDGASQRQRPDNGQMRQKNNMQNRPTRAPQRRPNEQMKQTREVQTQTVELEPLTQQNVDSGRPKCPRFVSFGVDKGTDMQYQNLLSKILNFGMLSMFTDLTDQATKISLMLVLKQEKQIAGKEIYKVIYKVENPKYVTGCIYYGVEFAVTAGVLDPNP